MSAVADVGDAVELTFTTAPGADVVVTWIDPQQVAVEEGLDVEESPAGSGKFSHIFVVSSAGVWTAQFTASGTTAAVERYYVRASALSGPPPFATIGDVTAQFGAMTPAQESLAGWLLRVASSMVRSNLPTVDQQIADGVVSPDMAALAVTNMTLRVMRNPNGLRSETTGPFSRSWDTTVAAGLLVLTDDDLALVTAPPVVLDGLAGIGVGSIRVTPGLAPPVGYPRRWGGQYGRYGGGPYGGF